MMTGRMVDKDKFKSIYERLIEDKINLKEEKPWDISWETKSTANTYAKKIDKLEVENKSIMRLLWICITLLVGNIIMIWIDVYKDNSILNRFHNDEIEMLNTINKYNNQIIELKAKEDALNEYINEKIQNEINKAKIDIYKSLMWK